MEVCKVIDCGVPQGSSLGSLSYSIFTNNLPLTLKDAKISMYADDSTIYIAKPTTDELNSVLNQELQAVVTWITNNKFVLYAAKTNSNVFGTKSMLTNKPKLRLSVNDVAVEQVQETKLLGIIFDNKLTWSKHIEKVINKMGKSLLYLYIYIFIFFSSVLFVYVFVLCDVFSVFVYCSEKIIVLGMDSRKTSNGFAKANGDPNKR